MSCPLCQKRPPKRYCPAKGERICSTCCGTEREVTIPCPADCEFLIAARRYEAEQRHPPPRDQVPFPDVELHADLIHEQRPVISGLGQVILKAATEARSLVDADAIAALTALAEAYRTLTSGIYYEKPPEGGPARGLYAELAGFLQEVRKQQTEQSGFAAVKDGDAFRVLVFFVRLAGYHTNGRPLSRAFLDYLRAQYPRAAPAERSPRIITP